MVISLLSLASCNDNSSSSSSSSYSSFSSSSTSQEIKVAEANLEYYYDFGIMNARYHNGKMYATNWLTRCLFDKSKFDNMPEFYIAGDYFKLRYVGTWSRHAFEEIGGINPDYMEGYPIDLEYIVADVNKVDDNLITRDENGYITHVTKYEKFEYVVIKTNYEFIELSDYNGDDLYVSSFDGESYCLYSFNPLEINFSKDIEKDWEWSDF